MTEYGTTSLDELNYFTCPCPVCSKSDPQNVKALSNTERQTMLAQHNLYTSFSEVRRIKQSITKGRLWEHLELRAHGHPALLRALKHLKKYSEYLETQSPVTKKSGLLFFSSVGLSRPEVTRHRERILRRYSPPEEAKILVLLPQTRMKPFHKSNEHRRALDHLRQVLNHRLNEIHVCAYAAPFGVIPQELGEVYPLSQYEIATPLDAETIEYTATQVSSYVANSSYKAVVLLQDCEVWSGEIAKACEQACGKKKVHFEMVSSKKTWEKTALNNLAAAVQKALARTRSQEDIGQS